MTNHAHTEHVSAAPADVYAALADVRNLPEYVPQITKATQASDGEVHVEARYGGHDQQGEAWFRADEDSRVIEWGTGDSYHGRMSVTPDGEGSTLTLELSTPHIEADHDIVGTLDAIKRLVESRM